MHHITHRGNNGQDVFLSDNDRSSYLSLLKERSDKYKLVIIGYCLMTNHIHLIAIPTEKESLSRAIRETQSTYSSWFNKRNNRTGHVWEGRFFSCPMDEEHASQALVYVDRNPARAGLVGKAWEYNWSSVKVHMGEIDQAGLVDLDKWLKLTKDWDWEELVRSDENEVFNTELRRYTYGNRPFGSKEFVKQMENELGIKLEMKKQGRPRKK